MKDNCDNVLVVVSNINFSNKTGAAYSRIMCYAKALAELDVNIYLTSALMKDYINIVDRIKISPNIYSFKESTKKTDCINPHLENFYFIKNYFYLRSLLKYISKFNNVTFLIYPSNFAILITSFLLKVKRYRVVIEKNELNIGMVLNYQLPTKFINKFIYFFQQIILIIIALFSDFIIISFDGIIVISTRLENLYRKVHKEVLRIPILSDRCSENLFAVKNQSPIFRIGYFGSITENKDGIISFLDVMNNLLTNNFNVVLNLYGTLNNTTKVRLYDKINKYNLRQNVLLHEEINHEQVMNLMQEQQLLLLVRPVNIQTNYGFSTKLAEYLLSGVPVLASNVSDNSIYIQDRINGFIVSDSDIESITKKIVEILSLDFKEYQKIGLNAKETASKYFNSQKYSEKIIKFLFKY